MKSILISIRPEYVEKILSNEQKIISLFQFKSCYDKIKYDIEKRPENIRNWEYLDLVEKERNKQ